MDDLRMELREVRHEKGEAETEALSAAADDGERVADSAFAGGV